MAAFVLFSEGRTYGGLHLYAGYGRIYQRNRGYIILMQIPKVLGSGSGSGELLELLEDILEALRHVNLLSVALGGVSLTIIVAARRFMPKFPMAVVIMAAGVLLTCVGHVDQHG